MRPSLAIAVGLLLALAYVPAAGAQGVPPDSEFDQYVPDVPEADKDVPVRDKKERGGSRGDGAVPEPVVEELAQQGEAGEAAADAAAATAPDAGKDKQKTRKDDGSGSDGETSSAAALAGAVAGSDSEGGMGILLPLIIAGAIGAGVAYAVVRRRIAGGDSVRAGDE